MYKIDLLRLLRRLGIVQLSVVCGICVWSSWRGFDSLRSPVALIQRKYTFCLTGRVKFHFAVCSILLFLSIFYKYLRDLGAISWTESLSKSRNAKAIFFDDMTKMDLVDDEVSVRHTLLLPLLCVFKIACSFPRPRPLPWRTWNRCSQGEDLGIEAVNR